MKTKKLVVSGFFIACGVILPMHIPVLIAVYFLGPIYASGGGVITPILSVFFTGMPPLVPVMPIMAFELCGYGLISGLVFSKTNKVYLSLIIAMIVGRLFAVLGAFVVSLTLVPQINPIMYVVGGLTTAIPGMLIQLIFIPILIKLLMNNKEISKAIA